MTIFFYLLSSDGDGPMASFRLANLTGMYKKTVCGFEVKESAVLVIRGFELAL